MSDWNSAQYLKFKKERTRPAIDLAVKIGLSAPKRVIDLGCGPGNSTAILKERFPNAELLGVDFSENMLVRAKTDYPETEFMQVDLSSSDWKLDRKFDIAFSNACIQWIPNHKALLPRIMDILNTGGKMAVQIPINYEEPVHKIIGETAKSDKWKNKIAQTGIFNTLTVEEYYDILSEISSDFEMWVTTYCHRMDSHDAIIEWYRSTGLKPYLEQLNDADKAEFTADVKSGIVKFYPVQKNGEVIFRFPRLFFVAEK